MIHCETFLKKLIVSSSSHLGNFCYGHYSVLSKTPLCLNHLSPSENLMTGSSTESPPELSLNWREPLNACHASSLGQSTSYLCFRQSGRGVKALYPRPLLQFQRTLMDHPSLRGPTQVVRAFIVIVLQPSSLSLSNPVSWLPMSGPKSTPHKPPSSKLPSLLIYFSRMLLSQFFLVDTLCLCLRTVMG